MTTKTLTNVRIKNADEGLIEAVFSVFDVVDLDGDVTRKGAFTDGAAVVISAYGHGSWEGRLPVGKGTIREVGNEAILDGQFFLNTTHGRDTFETIKQLSEDELQEWSYSLHEVESERGTVDGKSVRIIKRVGLVKEVSPVLRGAGIGTRTLSAKSAGAKQAASMITAGLRNAARERWGANDAWVWLQDWDPDESWAVFSIEEDDAYRMVRVEFTRTDDAVELGEAETDVQQVTTYAPKGARFLEQAESVVADVDRLVTRATEVVALRAAKGKSIAAESAEVLTRLDASLDRLKQLLAAPAHNDDTTTTTDDEAAKEFLRFVARRIGAST
jgi:hypothetical protein